MASVVKVFSAVKSATKVKHDDIDTNNLVFKMHYKISMWLLLLFTSIELSTELIGEKIRCTHSDPTDSRKQLDHVLDTYCFFMTTFIVPRHYNRSAFSDPYFTGVGPVHSSDEKVSMNYYQWVPYVLFLQAFSFYIPYLIWTHNGAKTIKKEVKKLQITKLESKTLKETEEALNKFPERMDFHSNWFWWFAACELLNLANVILQMFLTDWFLGGRFWSLGSQVYEHYSSTNYSPLDIVFPKVAKCTFRKYGPAGSLQTHDAICVLSLNIINEKAYMVLWYWYIILTIVSALTVIHRILSWALYRTKVRYNVTLFKLGMFSNPDSSQLLYLMSTLPYHDWFFLEKITRNVNPKTAKDLLGAVYRHKMIENGDWESDCDSVDIDTGRKSSGNTFLRPGQGTSSNYENRETALLQNLGPTSLL